MTKAILNRSYPDKNVFITSQGNVTYTELLRRIEQYARLFAGKGYQKAAIYAENSPAWIYAYYAALQNDCIAVPIDFMASAEDVAYIIDDCKPEVLFISNAMKEAYAKVGHEN